ncbi:MAG: hypothetical protein C4574_05545 [Candidatus Latescibacterota bacterium]|jgi:hypothetical protein|nr:MAG: hypothetical protein C4574_05545 [Candidatus Latescibacterota bacterium]
MSAEHRDLAAGRWKEMPLLDRMAHIGGEVERALSWRSKNNAAYSRRAFERALELVDLSLEYPLKRTHLREIARMREALVDYFYGANEYGSTEESWRRYFYYFSYAARRNF